LPAAEALARAGLEPLVLEAKEGLCLVNGTPCVTGLASLVLDRVRRLMDWADAVAAMSFETQRCQLSAIHPVAMALRVSPGLREVAAKLNLLLSDSEILARATGRKTQDALSLRAIPQVHGAVRDVWSAAVSVVDRELASVTDNPIVSGVPDAPQIYSQAHAVGAAVGLAMDQMAIAVAELGMISERRLDRMVNPLVSGLPAFLAQADGTASGFMIAQYAAVSLVGENRRLAAPAGLDGGITSGLQEDMLCHATPAALKTLRIIDNVRKILAIELLAACQSYDLLRSDLRPAPRTFALYQALRGVIAGYSDDRPLGLDITAAAGFIDTHTPDDILTRSQAA
jgi:histidine ammonia-lyase